MKRSRDEAEAPCEVPTDAYAEVEGSESSRRNVRARRTFLKYVQTVLTRYFGKQQNQAKQQAAMDVGE